MFADGSFEVNKISKDNLALIKKKQDILTELKTCELHSVAEEIAFSAVEMAEDGYDLYELLSMISDSLKEPFSKNEEGAANKFAFATADKISDAVDRAVFSKLFCEELKRKGSPISESEFLMQKNGGERFAYVKNLLADEAFDVFSQEFSEPRVLYAKSFKEAVAALLTDECQYCILPLEDRGGTRIYSVSELIYREGLKINSVTPVFGIDGTADMKYALVSKHLTIPPTEVGDDRYLEIRLSAENSVSLSELFSAASLLGVSLYRVNTNSFDTEGGLVTDYSVVFREDEGSFTELLVYLILFSKEFTPVGIYKNLE